MQTDGSLPTIGWREWIALPELGIAALKTKVDTGARSSSLHAFDIETFHRGGVELVRFKVHPLQRVSTTTIHAVSEVIEHRRVRSSSGHASIRPVICTEVELDGRRWTVELTLASRDVMGFRMLLGREAIRGRFVVDPGRSFVLGRRPIPRSPRWEHRKRKRR